MWWHEYEDDFSDDDYRGLTTREVIKGVMPYIKPYRKIFITAFVLSISGVGFVLLQPVILKQIIDQDIPSKVFRNILNSGLLYLGTMLLSAIFGFYASWYLQKAGVRAVNDIKLKLFGHLLSLGLPYLEQFPVGKLVSRIESDAQRLISLTSTMIQRVLMSVGMIVGAVTILALVDIRLFAIVMAIIPFVVGGTFFLFKFLRPYYREERARYANVSGVLAEFIKSTAILQIYDRLQWAYDRLKKQNLSYTWFTIRVGFMQYGIFRGLAFLEIAATVLALYFGAGWVKEGTMTVGSLVLFAQYIAQIAWPIIMLSDQLAEIQRAGGAADRIFTTLEMKPAVPVPIRPKALPDKIETIEFDNVSFSYSPEKTVLSGITFKVMVGETVAFVGPTGGGKTTIINLLCRLRDPDSGQILLNGIDIRGFDPEEYRRLFGLVLQDLYLFPANIHDNLSAFRSDISSEAIRKSAQIAGIDDIFSTRSKGYDMVLTEGGKDLSYGQRQLLAFARALTVNPRILVLDEATSSVDPGTEKHIQTTLNRLIAGRTNFFVAHRLSTIRHADRIFYIQAGQIVERGNHESLMKQKQLYYDLVGSQYGPA